MDLTQKNYKADFIDKSIKSVVRLILGFISKNGNKATFKKYIETGNSNRNEVYLTLDSKDVYHNWNKLTNRKDKPIVNESCISIYQETINALKYFTIYDEIQYVEFYEIIKRIEIALTDWVEITPRNNADNLSIITSEVIHNITEFFNVLLPEDVLEEFYGNPADDFIGDLD